MKQHEFEKFDQPHYTMHICARHRDNLETLARYLLKDDVAMIFDMTTYCELHDKPHGLAYNIRHRNTDHYCGTAGCAVGHGPFAGIMPGENDTDWGEYAEHQFGARFMGKLFSWCFAPDWEYVDNTPQGAAHRILYVLEHGIPVDLLNEKQERAAKAELEAA